MGSAPDRAELIEHLVRTRIAGEVDTPRQNNLKHYRRLAEGDPYHFFGLSFSRWWSTSDILSLMAKRCGVSPDEAYYMGADHIDPELVVAALDAVADRMAAAAHRRERVLLATGHPDTLLEMYQTFADALAAHGCPIITAGLGYSYETPVTDHGIRSRTIEWRGGVGIVTNGSEPRHSHDPHAMRAMLGALADEEWPQLVIADHGFAGAAGQAGVPTLGFADSNDPGLFLGEAEGSIEVTVPLDDGKLTSHYRPMIAYVLQRAGLS